MNYEAQRMGGDMRSNNSNHKANTSIETTPFKA